MPLISDEFRGDPKLEACLRDPAHHIKTLAVGEQVGKIQSALVTLDNAVIAAEERAAKRYGPSTAAAVLAFKRARSIINYTYQSKADDTVGQMTIARLDQELYQRKAEGVQDSRTITMTVGSISWIQGDPNPLVGGSLGGGEAPFLDPAWAPKTYIGLVATSNPHPPSKVDFPALRASRNFRSMTFCKFIVKIDANDNVSSFSVINAFHDPGFTPPFNKGRLPIATIGALISDWKDIQDPDFHPGEAGAGSLVATQVRHSNTVLGPTPPSELVLVNSLIKFRAGKHTDDIGIAKAGCPNHVPWVWCETLLTYSGKGMFNIQGRGSTYPSHAWYINDERIREIPESGDATWPLLPGSVLSLSRKIDLSRLKLNLIISAGAPASAPQPPASLISGGPVSGHTNAVPAGTRVMASVRV